jgi:3-dehydroquinate synthase
VEEQMKEIEIKIPPQPAGSYKVFISHDILGRVLSAVGAMLPKRSLFIVTDANVVKAGHAEKLSRGRKVPTYVIEPAGEESKTLATVAAALDAMEQASLGRDTVVIALGGGTVGDMAGFVAGIFKRGVPVVQVPTTTVAQADSAIGGKTGVDSARSKNAFGVFHHPAAVFIDVETLVTLNERHFNAGLAESVKHALIADAAYLGYLEKNIDDVLARKTETMEHLAEVNTRIKAVVVEHDPQEKNLRRILNYGHTVGHAVESASGYSLLHGEAVAIGMVAAGMIEAKMGLSDGERLYRVKKILERLGLPVAVPKGMAPDMLIDNMRLDKKAVARWPRFVLLKETGKVHCKDGQWAVDVPQEVIESVLKELCS